VRDVTTIGSTRYYTVAEAAALLKVSRSTVWRWIEAGRLPARRLGKRTIRIREEDLESLERPAKAEATLTRVGGNAGEDSTAEPKSKRFKDQLLSFAGAWSDIDADEMIERIYRWRDEAPPSPPVDIDQ
jgi:excisionase family DNA binding protein